MPPPCSAAATTRSPLFRPPAEGWAALHERMARREPFRDLEFQVQTPRQTRWLSISGRPRLDGHGGLIGYEGVGRDVTERRNAHEQLIASEQRWSMMARLAADWYWQTDAEHRLLPLSPEQHRRVGAQLAESVEGRTRWDAHRDGADAAAMGRAPRRPRRAAALPLAAVRDRCRRRPLAVDLDQRLAALRCRAALHRLPRRGPRHHHAQTGRAAAAAPQRGAAARRAGAHPRPAAAEPGPGRLRAATGARAAHAHRPRAGAGAAAGRTRRRAPEHRGPAVARAAGAGCAPHARHAWTR